MLITLRSELTGNEHTRDVPIDEHTLTRGHMAMQQGLHIQDAFPMLDADDREFLLTGITPDEWEAAFGPDPRD